MYLHVLERGCLEIKAILWKSILKDHLSCVTLIHKNSIKEKHLEMDKRPKREKVWDGRKVKGKAVRVHQKPDSAWKSHGDGWFKNVISPGCRSATLPVSCEIWDACMQTQHGLVHSAHTQTHAVPKPRVQHGTQHFKYFFLLIGRSDSWIHVTSETLFTEQHKVTRCSGWWNKVMSSHQRVCIKLYSE